MRELWHRASLAWQEILQNSAAGNSSLVVAHNAVNQALICTAIGLGPHYFRRLLQSNGATTVLDFEPAIFGTLRVSVNRINQSPNSPFITGAGREAAARVILLRHGATPGSEAGQVSGRSEEDISALGEV